MDKWGSRSDGGFSRTSLFRDTPGRAGVRGERTAGRDPESAGAGCCVRGTVRKQGPGGALRDTGRRSLSPSGKGGRQCGRCSNETAAAAAVTSGNVVDPDLVHRDLVHQGPDTVDADMDFVAAAQRERVGRNNAGAGKKKTSAGKALVAEEIFDEHGGIALHFGERR